MSSVNTIITIAYGLSSDENEQRTNVSLALSLIRGLIYQIDYGEY